jgi:hypothetical protein
MIFRMRLVCFLLSLFVTQITIAAEPALRPSTQPAPITLHLQNAPARTLIAELSKQTGAVIATTPPDLLEKTPPPPVTIDIDRQPFWKAIETITQKSGLGPVINQEEPYPRFQLGLGGQTFWEEPHAFAGPIVVFANDVERNNTVELGRTKHRFERELSLNLTAFAQPGIPLLTASPEVTILVAIDENGRSLKPAEPPSAEPTPADQHGPGNNLYTWNMTAQLEAPQSGAKKIARLKMQAQLRFQTASQTFDVEDVLKVKNLTRTVAGGATLTIRALKKADIEYVLQFSLRRDKLSQERWRDLRSSLYNGLLTLHDDKGRLVAARATENGGEYGNNKVEANLRFVREPGISDPNAGEPFKLTWQAPTAAINVPVEFELSDLPIPD